jgi:hypothetical protein
VYPELRDDFQFIQNFLGMRFLLITLKGKAVVCYYFGDKWMWKQRMIKLKAIFPPIISRSLSRIPYF